MGILDIRYDETASSAAYTSVMGVLIHLQSHQLEKRIKLGCFLPRTYRINLNPPARPLIAKRLGHLNHRPLRRRVDARVLVRLERSHRSNVDDLPRPVQRE